MRRKEVGPSISPLVLTWIALGVTIALLSAGLLRYGWSLEVHQQFWADIRGRLDGPMSFRFALQPLMASIAAIPDGIADARAGRWLRVAPNSSQSLLSEAMTSTARVSLLGISMDLIYQFRVFDRFHPAEAVAIALVLAIVPYFIVRWLVGWVLLQLRPDKSNSGGT
jgi:hypothetical protein